MNLLAQNGIGTITPPAQVGAIATETGVRGVDTFVTLLINLILSVSAVIFLFMILWGGVQWITSGGSKDKVAAARARIMHAIIGIAIVMLAAALATIIGKIFGFDIFGNNGTCPPGSHGLPGGGCGG